MAQERYDISRLPEYKLQVGDTLTIKFYRNEIDKRWSFDGGKVRCPSSTTSCAGLTPAELDQDLTRRYVGGLAIDITVIVTELGGHRVYVDGEVTKPSMVALAGGMTMLNAISSAGGFKPGAIREQVILIRRDTAGKPIGHAVDLKKVIFGKSSEGDVLLQPYDIVYVPRSKIANANLWVQQYIRDMLPINPGLAIPTQ
jgi:protein involved in polysaccharide export with SLBB domain